MHPSRLSLGLFSWVWMNLSILSIAHLCQAVPTVSPQRQGEGGSQASNSGLLSQDQKRRVSVSTASFRRDLLGVHYSIKSMDPQDDRYAQRYADEKRKFYSSFPLSYQTSTRFKKTIDMRDPKEREADRAWTQEAWSIVKSRPTPKRDRSPSPPVSLKSDKEISQNEIHTPIMLTSPHLGYSGKVVRP
ncbi:MAG: hypothetical protein DHS80DRAFT_21587 [Piptocephalis tieghemiana]|nr:MAG: hypothetical protein DHS80DRAFT_21587 [Piptocephalis tieghemiana]